MRFVIRKGRDFYTGVTIDTSTPVYFKGQLLGTEETYKPVFDGSRPEHGCQFDTRADAQSMLRLKEYGGPEAFEGCSIVPTE